MSMRTLLRTAAALAALACSPAMAQQCVGFLDVLSTASFCPNVEWMKNRGITTGCGTGTNYCPNDAVTRASMAIFMNRLGNTLTPTILTPTPTADSVAQHNLATPAVVCATGDVTIPAGSYPRRAHFNGRVNLYNPSANGDFIVEMVQASVPALAPGAPFPTPITWLAVQNTASYQAMALNLTPINDVTTHPHGYLDLDVNRTYRFGMRISRNTGTTANVSSYCVNLVSLASRVVAASPFDAAYAPAADAPEPQGRALPRP